MNSFLLIIFLAIIVIIIVYIIYINRPIEFTDIKTGCLYKRWGCCNDKLTPRLDPEGTNCKGF